VRLAYFAHSITSCWNNGNAHFQRGLLRELRGLGVEVSIFEEQNSWSLKNLIHDQGSATADIFRRNYPELDPITYSEQSAFEDLFDQHDVVIVHEWTPHWLVERMASLRRRSKQTLLFFHDTHHRIISAPQTLPLTTLEQFDGVIAFGKVLADAYTARGIAAFVLHEGADIVHFKPIESSRAQDGLIWIGNWGDDERSRDIEDYLLHPARQAGLRLSVFGVRYPEEARHKLAQFGAEYHGWCANVDAPLLYSRHCATIHIPRRYYVDHLPGIPTIRVFEALACGIPLLCAPWQDTEGLFRVNEDYLQASSPGQMAKLLKDVLGDALLRQKLIRSGLNQIYKRHSCRHRAQELLKTIKNIGAPVMQERLS
jgi:spore maturation protein CgeB